MSVPRPSSALQTFIAVGALLLLLSTTVFYFGADSSSGPNQVALLCCAGIAAVIGRYNGHTGKDIEQAIVNGIGLTINAMLLLLVVGALIGCWILSGTVPMMIYAGLSLLHPEYFYLSCTLLCGLVSLCIGSSWTVAATLGVALMGVAGGFELSPFITAGAIISGSYFGDKLSPMSDTTNLAAAVAGADLFTHIRFMSQTSIPLFSFSALIFWWLGRDAMAPGAVIDTAQLQQALQDNVRLGWYLLLPLLVILLLSLKRVAALPSLSAGLICGALLALVTQQPFIQAQMPADISAFDASLKMLWQALYQGIAPQTGYAALDNLLNRGGMDSMLNTIWLIICAMAFGAVMEQVGLLQKLVQLLLCMVRRSASLISATIVTAFATNCIAADQYISLVLPGRMFSERYKQQQLAPEHLSRALEDGGTVTSALVPWNTCGAYMHGVLQVDPLHYAVYCFYNWLTPLVAIALVQLGLIRLPAVNVVAEVRLR
jgi:NhaC family Na+:H+ antiporter